MSGTLDWPSEHHIGCETASHSENDPDALLLQTEDVRRHIKELLAAGIIKESRSPYASPIVVARKKSGAIRMCIDYCTLNARTVPDQYSTIRIDDALDCLAGSKWFSVLDLRSGYYHFADPTKLYILHVDASMNGLGAVLNQEHPNGLRRVAYASRKLSVSEQRYPIHQLEFLALKWAVVDKFHDYLYGAQFVVKTDNNPLTYVLSTAKLSVTGHRWLAALSTYNFSLQYKPGSHNIDADVRSCYPYGSSHDSGWKEITKYGVKAICQLAVTEESEESSLRLVDQLGVSPQSVPEAFSCPTALGICPMEQLTHAELRKGQEENAVIGKVMRDVECGKILTVAKSSDSTVALLQRQGPKLMIQNQLLHRVTKSPCGKENKQLVLPAKYWSQVLHSLHDDSGHLGVERTTELLKDRIYWPRMSVYIEHYVKNCGRCIARKTLPKKVAPFDLVCIYFLSIEPDSRGMGNDQVVTDHFTRYTQAFVTKDQKALTVAKILCDKLFVHYGLPSRIHSDQGRDFESGLIKELLRMLGIRKLRTSPYHPQGDPRPESFNRALLSMLGTLDPAEKSR